MRPHTQPGQDASGRARYNRTRGRRPVPEVTLRSILKAALARLRTLFAARHAGNEELEDTLGEQVTLPAAFPGPAERNTDRKTVPENRAGNGKKPARNGNS